ncbi:hypothetical protein [Nocardia sp. NPDC047654]|uniref:hypothetical protein n=1 Tax=Nocardia sp. NPDC047654 TaxID=3364314 RepID=UPI003719476B
MAEMSMERLVLQFMGAYTDLQDSMQFIVYSELPMDERAAFTKKNPDDRILDQFKKVCRDKLNVAIPETLLDCYNGARPFRNDLAHLLSIESIGGKRPNRTMTIIRYDNYTTTGEWARQNKKKIEITESELRAWTEDLRYCRKVLNVMLKIAAINSEFNQPDDTLIEVSWIPWWDGRWGKLPKYGEECRAPIGRYRAQTNPRKYWVPKPEWTTPTPREIVRGNRQ